MVMRGPHIRAVLIPLPLPAARPVHPPAAAVVRIKGAIKKLSEELHEMEVRIGVVSHTLLQLSVKNRRLMQAQAVFSDDEEDA